MKEMKPIMEARQFFADPNCEVTTYSFPPDFLKTFVDELYEAGAKTVLFARVQEFEGKKYSSWFIVELPQDAAAKKSCIEAWNQNFEGTDFEGDLEDDADFVDVMLA